MLFWAWGLHGGQASQAASQGPHISVGEAHMVVMVTMGDDYQEGEAQWAVGRRCRGKWGRQNRLGRG